MLLPGEGEARYEEWNGRVSGNNVVHWRPSLYDWYETVKLNYGHDFTTDALHPTCRLRRPDSMKCRRPGA